MIKLAEKILKNQLYAISLYTRQIVGTLIIFVIARYLSVYNFGLFSSYKNIVAFCFMFANLGYADYILVSSKANVNDVKNKITIFLYNALFVAITVGIFSIFFRLDNHLVFWLIIIRTFFDSTFFVLILPYFQASKKFNLIAKINFIYAFCLLLVAVLSFVFKLSLTKFLLLNILFGFINFIQCTYYTKLKYYKTLLDIKNWLKHIDKSIFAYMGVTIAYFLYAQIPSFYVSTTQTKENAALYFSAFTVSSVIGLFISAQIQKMLPSMINASKHKIKTLIKDNLKIILIVTIGLFLFMCLFGKFILIILYGQKYYTNAYFVLLILTFANICIGEAAIFGTYITASGNQKKKIPMQIEASLVTTLFLLILNKYGIYGASIAYLTSSLYVSCRYTTYTLKILKKTV